MQNQNNGVFVISLDAVDLNLLPAIYNQKPDKVAPLWSRSNLQMRSNDYYNFEIKCKDCDESNEDIPPKHEYKHRICHMCDIEVPLPFWNDHMKSVKHKSNVKIADIAIERMKKYLNEAHHELDDELHTSAHFCATCVTVIDSKDIDIHEKSLAHRNAYIVEKLFNDFLVLYNFDESNTNDVLNEPALSNLNDVETTVAHNLIGNEDKTNEIANAEPLSKIYTDEASNIKDPLDITTNKDTFNLIAYIDLLNNSNDTKNRFKVLNENLIEISAIDGSIVKVRDNHFNGINKIGNKHWYCLMCEFSFKKAKSDEHKMSAKHIHNVSLPVKDKHCLRYIQDKIYHCVICNTIAENSDLHLLSNEDHDKLLKIALISDKGNSPTSSSIIEESQIHAHTPLFEKVTDSEQSAQKSPSYAEKVKTHQKSTPHNNKMNSTSKETSNQTITNEINNIPSTVSKPFSLPSKTGAIEKVVIFPVNRYFCDVCNVFISKKTLSRHKLRPKHILNSRSDSHYLMAEIDDEYLFCKVCDICINNSVENVRKHVIDEGHKIKYENLLLCNSISRIDRNKLYCELCEEYVLSRNEILHIGTIQHQHKFDTTEIIGFSHNEQENLEHDKENLHFDKENLHFDKENLDDDKENLDDDKVNLDTDKVNLDDDKVNLDDDKVNLDDDIVNLDADKVNLDDDKVNLDDDKENHNEEDANRASDREKVEQGNQVPEISKTVVEFYQCKVCDVKVPNYSNNIQEHLNGRAHLRNLEFCLVDSVDSLESTSKTEDSVEIYHYHLEQSELPNCLNCIICNVKIQCKEHSVTRHIYDSEHTKNYETLLENNFLVNRVNNIHCTLCAVDVGVKCELLHIKGRKHKKNMENYKQNIQPEIYVPSDDFIIKTYLEKIAHEMLIFLKEIDKHTVECTICEVHIPFTELNVRTHMNGNRHAKNLNSKSTNNVKNE